MKKQPLFYAGVGARSTPEHYLDLFTRIATRLELRGFILRSGGARGADAAFEVGTHSEDNREIFYARSYDDNSPAMALAKKYHPNWTAYGEFPRRLHARNAYQILGDNLDKPVEFVICYTPDGAESHAERSIKTGGTGTAISIAEQAGIPVYNFQRKDAMDRLTAHVLKLTT